MARGSIIKFNPEFYNDNYPIDLTGVIYEDLPENDWVKVNWNGKRPNGTKYNDLIYRNMLIIIKE